MTKPKPETYKTLAMTNEKRIFISHHNSDAAALSQLKDDLAPMGFACFLAHEDINPGEHDLNRIEKEIQGCDAFLYVSSEEANASAFCQQEIGMAKALERPIITAMTRGNPPEGFISRIQAVPYKAIDANFCDSVHEALYKKFPPTGLLKKRLDALGYKGFSRTAKLNIVHLEDDNWDDYSFCTTFQMKLNEQNIGQVKIGYQGQTPKKHTHDELPSGFLHLRLPFFSRVCIDDSQNALTGTQIENLKYLLNDTDLMSETDRNTVANEEVYRKSLFRTN